MNKTQMPTDYVHYTPAPGFTGPDIMSIDVFSDMGTATEEKIIITVQ